MKHQVVLPNSEIAERISEHVHSERNRQIMRMKLIDGYTYEQIAEVVQLDPRYIRALVRKLSGILKIS